METTADDGQKSEDDSACVKIAHTAEDGKKYETKFYRLEAVLSVGCWENSIQATDFLNWATTKLNEFIIKSFDR